MIRTALDLMLKVVRHDEPIMLKKSRFQKLRYDVGGKVHTSCM